MADAGTDLAGSTTRQAYDLLARGFGPGFNCPLHLAGVVHDQARRAHLTEGLALAVGLAASVERKS